MTFPGDEEKKMILIVCVRDEHRVKSQKGGLCIGF